jgi:hypothetical protein
VLAAALAGPAAAQEKACRAVEGGRLMCVDGLEAVIRRTDHEIATRPAQPTLRQEGDDKVAAAAQPYMTRKQLKLVEDVAKAMRAGRCDRAETLALKAGDHELAQEAARRCIPAPAKGG